MIVGKINSKLHILLRIHASFSFYSINTFRYCIRGLWRAYLTVNLFIFLSSQGGAISILTVCERPQDFAGVVLIAPLVQMNAESATPFKVKRLTLNTKHNPVTFFPVVGFQKLSKSSRMKELKLSARSAAPCCLTHSINNSLKFQLSKKHQQSSPSQLLSLYAFLIWV